MTNSHRWTLGKSLGKTLGLGAVIAMTAGCAATALRGPQAAAQNQSQTTQMPAAQNLSAEKTGKVTKIKKTEAEWKKILTLAQFHILREKGTDRPFTGDYHPHEEDGIFRCAGCNLELYNSSTQFESGTGWPSFWKPIAGHVIEETDADGERTEVLCARCDGHLGHVFNDGPEPTGLRYCMNATALKWQKS